MQDVFHEKARFVKTNMVAITLERIICPVATLPFALSLQQNILYGSVHDGVRLFGPTLQSQNRSLPERDQDNSRSRRDQTLAGQQQQLATTRSSSLAHARTLRG